MDWEISQNNDKQVNWMEAKQYVIVDLEMCRVPKDKRSEEYPLSSEIIEIGAVLVNEQLEIADSFKIFVAPQFGGLDDYIQKLTGITNTDLADAPAFPDALDRFLDWLPEGAVFVSWSDNDEYQLGEEAYYKNADSDEFYDFLDTWEDCQKEFGEKMHSPKTYKLSEALIIADLPFDENIHDALVDAKNTAMLFVKMKKEPELILSPYYSFGENTSATAFRPFANLF